MTLWIRYGKPIPIPLNDGRCRYHTAGWEVYGCGGLSRYVVMRGRGATTPIFSTNSRNELRIRMQIMGLSIGRMIGFSTFSSLYDIWGIGNIKDFLWRGYALIEIQTEVNNP